MNGRRYSLPDYLAAQPMRSVLAGLGIRQGAPVHVLVFAYRLAGRPEGCGASSGAEPAGSRHVSVTCPVGGLLTELSARNADPADEEAER
ncbi:hypothetical protein ACH4FX_38980 [Streptomyces sp. NPDC018019]|uniref:hypothetical protein n=1 Tax=Streptomyces sp. NPDC018019 TaxID=3365030 RepID=UPI0037A463B2